MVLVRSRVSFLTLAVFVAFFLLRIDVVIGICLQRSLTGWRQGDTSPSPPGGRWDQRVSEIGGRGIGQIIDTRRFSIPVSQSIRLLVSRHLSCYCNCLKSSMSNYLHLLKLRVSVFALPSSHSRDRLSPGDSSRPLVTESDHPRRAIRGDAVIPKWARTLERLADRPFWFSQGMRTQGRRCLP